MARDTSRQQAAGGRPRVWRHRLSGCKLRTLGGLSGPPAAEPVLVHGGGTMSIPTRLSDYLDQRSVQYEVCTHGHSRTSAETSRLAHIPSSQLAKSVIVEDDAGCVMAVVPANRNVLIGRLSRVLERQHLRLADEARIAALFVD